MTDKEKQNQIIEDAYKNYIRWAEEHSKTYLYEPYAQEQFIIKIKTDKDFSERWGLQIEERVLSLEERRELYIKKYGSTDGWHFIQYEQTIPTRAITLTYKDEKIETYE